MSTFQTIDDLHLTGKVVLLRVDFNVPVKDGRITDATRIVRSLPTIRALIKAGAKVVILSHFGRPKGKPNPEFSLRPVAAGLSSHLNLPVAFAEDCIGSVAKTAIAAMENGDVLLLENVRFYPEEEANDADFAQKLAALGDVFVNDAFAVAHRKQASVVAIASFLPSVAGRLMQEELTALSKALVKPEKPLAALVGGSKISTKLDLLNNLICKVDILVLGGGMANTFMAAKGLAVGKSLHEADMLDTARTIMETAEAKGCNIMLPKDVVVATELKENAPCQTVAADAVPTDAMIFDLGTEAVAEIKATLALCKTVIWNGPLGVFETPPFDKGTNEVAICVADLTKRGKILSVAGGGDTVSALDHAGVTNGISYLSTAGGAFLEWMEGKQLPGVVALENSAPDAKKGKMII
ncbi:MAG: phosphoglycerate kinase [Alphaproteobacteria bacterium]|nr:phosphoglycerate kinase [Alphaproteobacteria bacterium]